MTSFKIERSLNLLALAIWSNIPVCLNSRFVYNQGNYTRNSARDGLHGWFSCMASYTGDLLFSGNS